MGLSTMKFWGALGGLFRLGFFWGWGWSGFVGVTLGLKGKGNFVNKLVMCNAHDY